jgi:hypothetical protein
MAEQSRKPNLTGLSLNSALRTRFQPALASGFAKTINRCVGFVLARRRGEYEGFDRDERSIGTFATVSDAGQAVIQQQTP